MIHTHRDWLPEGAAAPAAAQSAIDGLFEEWSAEWLEAAVPCAVGSFEIVASPHSELRIAEWHHNADGVSLGFASGGAEMLGALALGVPREGARRTPADMELLGELGNACLDDLKARFAALFRLDPAAWQVRDTRAAGGSIRRVAAIRASETILTVELSDAAFARFVKACLPAAPVGTPLGSPASALAALPVQLTALLGRCELSAAELADLAAGDVLMLDRAFGSPLPLAVAGSKARKGNCTVVEKDGRPALEIIEVPAA